MKPTPKKKRARLIADLVIVALLLVLIGLGLFVVFAPPPSKDIGSVNANGYTFKLKSESRSSESYRTLVSRCQGFLFFDGCHTSSIIEGAGGDKLTVSLSGNILILTDTEAIWRCSTSAPPVETVQTYYDFRAITVKNASATLTMEPPPAC